MKNGKDYSSIKFLKIGYESMRAERNPLFSFYFSHNQLSRLTGGSDSIERDTNRDSRKDEQEVR